MVEKIILDKLRKGKIVIDFKNFDIISKLNSYYLFL